jgi:hypothetical protein
MSSSAKYSCEPCSIAAFGTIESYAKHMKNVHQQIIAIPSSAISNTPRRLQQPQQAGQAGTPLTDPLLASTSIAAVSNNSNRTPAHLSSSPNNSMTTQTSQSPQKIEMSGLAIALSSPTKVEEEDDDLVVQSLADQVANLSVSTKTFECVVCRRTFGTQVGLNEHARQESHINKLSLEERVIARFGTAPTEQPNPFCAICDKMFDSKGNYYQHLLGGPHQRQREKANRLNEHTRGEKHTATSSLKERVIARFGTAPIQQRASFCALCDKTFDSKGNYYQHLLGGPHQKQMGKAIRLSEPARREKHTDGHSLEERVIARFGIAPTEQSNPFCAICDKMFDSKGNYYQHLLGGPHQKQLEKAALPPNKERHRLAEISVPDDDDPDWVAVNKDELTTAKNTSDYEPPPPPPCVKCNVSFASFKQRKAHVKSAKHRDVLFHVVSEAKAAFRDLDKLNAWLTKLGKEPQPSKNKAIRELRTVRINIFDLVNHRFDKVHKNHREFVLYTRKHQLFFPLEEAKGSGLSLFLVHIRF